MKKLLFTLCLWLTVSWLWAQQNSDPKLFTGNAAVQDEPIDASGTEIHLQVGGPIPYAHTEAADMASFSIRFPWDVAYIPLTFDEQFFDVSKGYFSDKIQIDWTFQNNGDKVTQIKIFRRAFKESNLDDDVNYAVIATLSKDTYSYTDNNTQGGLLYEYKVEALGVSTIPKKYVTYNTGIGYRNPTGVVAGNVSFDGGSPVKDVVIRADPQGGDLAFGNSLSFSASSSLVVPLRNKELKEEITLQAWVKLNEGHTATLFTILRATQNIDISYTTTNNSLHVSLSDDSGVFKTFLLEDFYPTGNVDGKGDDIFNSFSDSGTPQTDLSENFIHLTVVLENNKEPLLYLNGRNITEDYIVTLPAETTSRPVITTTTSGNFPLSGSEADKVIVGEGLSGNIDEVRLWSKALTEKAIRTDFKRYLGGSEQGLIAYLRCDETAGEFAYDISKIGVEFNRNHGRILNATWTQDKPTASQLGILGVTDSLGNYIISAIPYSGTGDSYTITPLLGVHQFQPGQQLIFVGAGSEVTNKVDFTDISAFDFKGVVYYTTEGVFPPIGEKQGDVSFVKEDGYNQYNVIIDNVEQRVSQGDHYYDGSTLYETPRIFVAGANVYIDGDIVLDKSKRPLVTNEKGEFNIKVPIGDHYVEVRKINHVFAHEGRFPAARADGDDLFEFFEHQQTPVTFLDTTRVSLVGRVVGGTREAEKPVGFGHDGALEETYVSEADVETTVDISSINNIGQAEIKLSYLPYQGTPGQELKVAFTTNDETGEYKVDVLPLGYTIMASDVRIPGNPEILLLEANETINLSEVPEGWVSEYIDPNGETIESEPYHFEKSFTYRSVPVLNVVSQSSDTEVRVKATEDGKTVEKVISTEGFDYRVFTQGLPYAILFETYEEYVNKDAGETFDRVPISDGEFNITNNLALADSETLTVDPENESLSKYVFRAGLPSIDHLSSFTRSINISYRVDGVDYDAIGYDKEGIILGGQSDGSQVFVTQAPDVPDIILRDPPGSNSFASIEEGQSFSFKQEASTSSSASTSSDVELKLGSEFTVGGGLAGPVVKVEVTNSITAGVALKLESSDGESLTKTYTFNRTIATSSDPGFVGSNADLYIGNTNNYFYGSYDHVQASAAEINENPSITLENAVGESIVISKQKAFYFAEEPSTTTFVYSQKHILETLIPELEGIIRGIDDGTITEENSPGVLKKSFYEEQIRTWKKVVQENELTKYRVLHQREAYRQEIMANIQGEIDIVNIHLLALTINSATQPIILSKSIPEAISFLRFKKSILEEKMNRLNDQFSKNISFDAGVGEYSDKSEISIAEERTRNIKLEIDQSLEASVGFEFNETGLTLKSKYVENSSINTALTEDETTSTVISYTLQDSDPHNFLSVDVINAFDGNGPVFSTIGGRTSCPYEGIDTTVFYRHSAYLENSNLVYSGGERIGFATQKVEVPGISVEVASLTDIPEERAAEFKLILENNSLAGTDANFILKVENTTNPHNAIFNIAPNGTVVFVPYGQRVEYALTLRKSISDVYEYNEIDIILESLCDGSAISEKVTLSAVFRPSCTAVEIDRPLENWVVNAGDAFNLDNTTNPMAIAMFGYNRNFSSFENFRLEYRKSTSSSWTRLQTYYNTADLLEEAVVQGEDQGTLIAANTTSYPWDIGALGLADGQYELRLVSQCSNGTEYISRIVQGTVDLNIPLAFGTPSPTDGILEAGEDLRLQFSEDILYSSALSKIEIKGETNQQEINHNVSIHFEGADNNLVVEKPNILPGDLTIEFWMNNQTSGSGTLFEQTGALEVVVGSGSMDWTFGGHTLSVAIAEDEAFHHYTLSYNHADNLMKVYQDDQELATLNGATGVTSKIDDPLIIGGNSFVGNLHDLRFWSRPLTLSEAYAAQFNELTGSERDLVGYWPMDEGTGTFANDLARFKHAAINAAWDIKPKGTGYDFRGGQYLIMDEVNFVQLSDRMDVTLSFWMKTDQTQKATIFSNGRGNGDDLIQSNGKANKWAVTIDAGILFLHTEGLQFKLSETDLADNTWHHIAIVLKRTGSLRTYVDAALESSNPARNIGGISGNKFWVGARGFISGALEETVDEIFTGKIDELRLWNMARATEQTDRDRFNEVDLNTTGLMLYARMNTPDPLTGNGPQYYHTAANETMLPSDAVMNLGTVSYTDDAPQIKQVRPYLNFQVSYVINGDEMIITPLVSDWSVLEEQIIDITVDRMFDVYGNRQSSPVTWSAFIRRNEVAWFAADNTKILEIEKEVNEPYSFEITLLNKGGKFQPYAIDNIPSWLSANSTSGTLDPNSSKTIVFTIAPELAIGQYSEDLFLDTDFNFDEKIFLDLRVLGKEPVWVIDPAGFENSMNIIGKIRVNGIFSQDSHSKVAAFAGGEIRGVAHLEYDQDYDEHFVYLNVLSNEISGEDITFRLWDASIGKIFHATINGALSLPFIANEVIGFKSVPAVFESTGFIEQNLMLNKGWTWVSVYVEDPSLVNLNDLTDHIQLSDNDLIKSQSEFDLYDTATGWNGTLTAGGGLNTSNMYKFKLGTSNNLVLGGNEVDISAWSANIMAGWNWLAYPLSNNVSLNEAMASLDATEGDVIKNQKAFAIYDPRIGWTGPLTYMIAGEGYMLRSGLAQNLTYPDIFKSNPSGRLKQDAYPVIEDWALYEHNMNIVAEVATEEMYDTVWVVDTRGSLRGRSAILQRDGRQLSYITVFGSGAEQDDLRFYLGNDFGEMSPSESLRFKPDMILGTVQEPFVLNLKESSFSVYPNAFTETIRLRFNATYAHETEIELIDVTGHVVFRTSHQSDKGPNELMVEPEVTEGLYILSVVVDGRRMTSKVIRK